MLILTNFTETACRGSSILQKQIASVLFSFYLFIGFATGTLFVATIAGRCKQLAATFLWIIDPMTAQIASLSWPTDPASADNSFSKSVYAVTGGLSQQDIYSPTADFRGLSGPIYGSSPVAGGNSLLSIDHRSPNAQPWLFNSGISGHEPVSVEAGELVVVDRGVKGWEHLVEDLRGMQRGGRQLDVVVLDDARDGVRQISQALAGYQQLSALHIISHGSVGGLQLGNAGLSDGNLSLYAADLVGWRDSLVDGADILIYGCDVASGKRGQSFVDGMAALIGADVAASSDVTGHGSLGGDWALEYRVGDVRSEVAVSAAARYEWVQSLQTININQAWLTARGPGPYYLDQAGATYVLQTDVSTAGTAFAVIADDITFDLNGRKITYNNATPTTVFNNSFEQGQGTDASGWNYASANSAARYQGEWLANELYDGQYSLRLAAGAGEQYVVSNTAVTLQANVTYSLSGMFYRKLAPAGTELYVQLVNAQGQVAQEVVYSNSNNRGIQFKETEFTMGGSAGTYFVRAGVRNGSGSNYVFIDDIKIQRTKVYGVAVGAIASDSAQYPDLTQFGRANRAIVRNGTIEQGADGATWAHTLSVRRSDNVFISGVNLTANGANTSVLYWNANEGRVENSNLTSNVRTITSRDDHDGAVVQKFRGVFANNTIHNGVHSGINMETGTSSVYGNTIRLKTKYTNSFAIVARGDVDIYQNRIENHQGEYASRGIMVSSNTTGPVRIHDNVVMVQLLRNNQEYGGGSNQGAMLGGCYGLQIEEGAGNVEIWNNEITVYGNDVRGYAFRASSDSPQPNTRVHHNIFRAVAGNEEAASVKISGQGASSIFFEDNTLISNDMWVGDSRVVSNFQAVRTTLKVDGTTQSSRVMQSENWNRTLEDAIQDFRWIDPVYDSESVRQRLESAAFLNRRADNGMDEFSSFVVDWTTTFAIVNETNAAIANATLRVLNNLNEEVFLGTTDANGRASALLRQFRTVGETNTSHNAHRVIITANGEDTSYAISADRTQTLTLVADGESHDAPHLLEYVGTKLLAYANNLNNRFVWSALDPFRLQIDGFTYNILNTTTEMVFYGLAGTDTLALTGSAGDDQITVRLGDMGFTAGSGLLVNALGFEQVAAAGGGGTNDRAVLFDSAGSDVFNGAAASSTMSGNGYSHQVTGFHRVIANSTAGNDLAQFQDSAGDDSFVANPGFASMTSGQFTIRANGFKLITANATAGGNDVAGLTGSLEVNVFTAHPTWATLTRFGYEARVNGFDSVFGYSGAANNVAWLYDSAGKDTLAGNMVTPRMFGTGFSNIASGFTRVYSVATVGDDKLNMGDSAADDVVTVTPGLATLVGGGILVHATGFVSQVVRSDQGGLDTVYLRANGSSNTANIFDSFSSLSSSTQGYFLRGAHFANTFVELTGGGTGNQIYMSAPTNGAAQQMQFLNHYGWARHSTRLRQFSGFNRATVQYREGVDSWTTGSLNYELTMVRI